ncbi:hypothetical protein PoB_000219600 [Plakobranchus ocellatus]|uniref:Uncharacterized protein n=1 Tax=Plakobranchus ocellatus TaxID=259542 RepID=A0AAV3XXW9_9GAST|nr:hypothetical protein PoB_000219600 [Plakobranchus ocellatus]
MLPLRFRGLGRTKEVNRTDADGLILSLYKANQQDDLRLQVFRQARAPLARLEPTTGGSLQILGFTLHCAINTSY